MVAPFSILCLMIDHTGLYFTFRNIQVTLVVLAVIHGIPQTPFHASVNLHFFYLAALIGQYQIMDLAIFSWRYKKRSLYAKTVFYGAERGISHTVAAFVLVQCRFGR